MFFYVFTYIIYVLICCGFSIVTKNVNFSKYQILIFLLLLLIINSTIVSFRPIFETADTSIYYDAWKNVSISKLKTKSKIFMLFGNREFYSMEIGFLYVMACLKKLITFRVFLWLISFVTSCLTCYSMTLIAAYGLKIYKNKTEFSYFLRHKLIYIWTVYLVFVGVLYTSVAIRSGLSIALCCCGVAIAVSKKNILKPIFFLILGTLINTSGIIFIIIWILLRFGKKSIRQLTIYFFCFIFSVTYFLKISKFTVKSLVVLFNEIRNLFGISGFSSYLNNVKFQFQLREGYVIFFIGLFLALNYKNLYNISKLALVTIFGLALATFGAPIHAISRVTDLFMIFVIPIICSELKGNNWKNSISYISLPLLLYPQIILCFARID